MEAAKKNNRTLYSYDTEEEEQLARNIAKTMYQYDHIAADRIDIYQDVNEGHVKQFWDQGYLVIDKLLNEDEVDHATQAVMDIVCGRIAGPRVQLVRPASELKTDEQRELATRKLFNYIEHEPRLGAIAYHKNILGLMEKLFKEKPKVVQDQAILKPPTGGAEKPWHQDMAYGNLTYNKAVIGIWIALDHAELDNGCMHVIPGSHMEGAVPHYTVRDLQLCDRNVHVDRDVAVPLKPGGALIFSGLLHHGTPPNFSTKRRRALQFHYAPESAQKMTSQEYKIMFTNQVTGAEC